ncbi:4-oxalomesaconate tautomerase [uncultured Cohaesibacter sp.]|uniref:4-oxalomesaconate tautomerase n=1 Tax=uncultured Cohaesibacter sp. TaxID=1002546 RepID=UPI0029C8B802|nr:4-oxalomesaconate tautomerase [uncultured Cohaesibacter sp.]
MPTASSSRSSGAIRAMWMRGGTSKGGFFLASDLPSDSAERDAILLRIMGSPDARQIDGMGGADPLTSKVAIVKRSERAGVDVDYLFLQVFVDKAIVTDGQTCGNILAGVAPFAIERGLVEAKDDVTEVAIYMENTGQIAIAEVQTPDRVATYKGQSAIDGVPGRAAAIPITFRDSAGSSCGALLPSGNAMDIVEGFAVTMIDNGMPCVLVKAEDMGISGTEKPEQLDSLSGVKSKLEHLRLACGYLMQLGDVSEKSVPKMVMVSQALYGGAINTRSFIPHSCHKSIGVLGAVSVATACLTKGTVAHGLARIEEGAKQTLSIEHPAGEMSVVVSIDPDGSAGRAAILRTARKLMDGTVFTD